MEEIIKAIAEPLGQVLVVVVNAAIVLMLKWLRERFKSEGAMKAIEHLSGVAQGVVVTLNQQVVEALKNDGKFDAGERARIKILAVDMVNKQTPDVVRTAAGYMVNDITAIVDGLIEQAVVKAKAEECITTNYNQGGVLK